MSCELMQSYKTGYKREQGETHTSRNIELASRKYSPTPLESVPLSSRSCEITKSTDLLAE